MAWTDRLREHVKFVSPSGLEFTPLWKGDEISAEKRLGRHAYPNMDKEVVQDLGMNSREIPLAVYFDGPDNDKESRAFENALYEPETWEVTHPVDGLMRLQLVSYKRPIDPVESGNVTVFETEWIEPADDEDISVVPDPAADVEAAVEDVKRSALKEFLAALLNTVAQIMAVVNAVRRIMGIIRAAILLVDAVVNGIQNAINNVMNAAHMAAASLAGAVTNLIAAPGLIAGSVVSGISAFADLGRQIVEDLENAIAIYTPNRAANDGSASFPNSTSDFSVSSADTAVIKNTALVGQLFLNAVTVAMAQKIISSPPETRREALSALAEYQRFTHEAQTALERVATATANSQIEKQFVARANSGEAIATLNAAVVRYLMGSMFSLKIERRITLDRPRAPLEVAITEYKANGENADYYYDLLCRTNHLHGRELLLLPTGKEVVIYG